MTEMPKTAAGVAGAVGAGALGSRAERDDCPGTIVCPLTGEVICADECPVGAVAQDVALPVEQPRSCCAGAGE